MIFLSRSQRRDQGIRESFRRTHEREEDPWAVAMITKSLSRGALTLNLYYVAGRTHKTLVLLWCPINFVLKPTFVWSSAQVQLMVSIQIPVQVVDTKQDPIFGSQKKVFLSTGWESFPSRLNYGSKFIFSFETKHRGYRDAKFTLC